MVLNRCYSFFLIPVFTKLVAMKTLSDMDQKWRAENGLEPLSIEEVEKAKTEAQLYPSVWYATADKHEKRSALIAPSNQ